LAAEAATGRESANNPKNKLNQGRCTRLSG
jgi:hypothetical protein